MEKLYLLISLFQFEDIYRHFQHENYLYQKNGIVLKTKCYDFIIAYGNVEFL